MRPLVLCTVILGIAGLSCQKPVSRLNAPPHGTTERPSPMQAEYTQMTDNALLEDMSISDVHFLPHRAFLTNLGEQRLTRLAALMEAYGGTIRFSTDLQDDQLVEARVAQILEFLSRAGIDTSATVLTRDLPGGTGIDASQAILIKANEGVYKPKKQKDGGTNN